MLDYHIARVGNLVAVEGLGCTVRRVVLKDVQPHVTKVRTKRVQAGERVLKMFAAVAGNGNEVDRLAGSHFHAGTDILPEGFSELGVEWLNLKGVLQLYRFSGIG